MTETERAHNRLRCLLSAEVAALENDNQYLSSTLHDIDNVRNVIRTSCAVLVNVIDRNNKRINKLKLEVDSLFDNL